MKLFPHTVHKGNCALLLIVKIGKLKRAYLSSTQKCCVHFSVLIMKNIQRIKVYIRIAQTNIQLIKNNNLAALSKPENIFGWIAFHIITDV